MKHRMFLSTLGFAALAFTATPSHAASDPSGIWLNDVGSAKMEVTKCGKGICAKIVWLKDPNDSKGKPLHDVRGRRRSSPRTEVLLRSGHQRHTMPDMRRRRNDHRFTVQEVPG